MRAELSAASDEDLSCSCPLCEHRPVTYRWYNFNKSSDQWSLLLKDSSGFRWPEKFATYSCQAVWENGRSLLSRSCESALVDQLIVIATHPEICQTQFSVT